jgi:hypothetical protein
VVAKSILVMPRSCSNSDTLTSSVTFSRVAAWVVSPVAVSAATAAVLALSAASSGDVVLARSFSTPVNPARWQLLRRQSRRWCRDPPPLASNFKGRPHRRLARHGSGCRHPGYDQLHLQLGPFHTKLAHCTSSSPT